MRVCKRGGQMLMTTAGAFAAFSLMTVAVGTDYWLYSRGVCQTKSSSDNDSSHKNEEVLTHSGLWRTCCMEGTFTGVCKEIDHFAEESDYEQDAGEYLLRAVRASSVFPILSVGLQFAGGVCVAASEFYKTRYNVILSAGILFVSAGLSNIIGIIVYISAAAGDPNQSESKRSHWYGWSFYCGAFSFVVTETVGVLAVHLFIDAHRRLRLAHPSLRTHTHARLSWRAHTHPHALTRVGSRRSSSYRSRYRRRPSRLSETRSVPLTSVRQPSLWRPPGAGLPGDLAPLYALGYGYGYTHPVAHTHSGPAYSGLPHTHTDTDSHTHTHTDTDTHAQHVHGNGNNLHHNNSLPHTHTHSLARGRDSVKSADSFDHTHTHTHTHAQNSVQSGEGLTEEVTHTQNNVSSNNTHAHTQNSVNSEKAASHTHGSMEENTHTNTHTQGGFTRTGTATRRTTPV